MTMQIAASQLDENVKPGMYEETQDGLLFPDGRIIWNATGQQTLRSQYGEITFVEPSPDFFSRYPRNTLGNATKEFRKKLRDQHIPVTDDMILKHVRRKITVIVGETEVVQ